MAESLSYESLEKYENEQQKSSLEENYRESAWVEEEITSIELYEKYPIPSPKYAGEDLNLNCDLVKSGLSAISIKHHPKSQRFSKGCRWMSHSNFGSNLGSTQLCHNPTSVQPRNSYTDLHYPDLMNLKWAKNAMELAWKHYIAPILSNLQKNALTPENRKEVIEKFFHEHASYHGNFCSSFHGSLQARPVKAMLLDQTSKVHINPAPSPVESNLIASKIPAAGKENEEEKIESGDLEIIMNPLTRHDSSIENTVWKHGNLQGTAQTTDTIVDMVDLRRGTGSGEEESNEAQATIAVGGDEDLSINSDGAITEVIGEAGATVTTRTNDKDLGFLKILHRSPGKMHIITLESPAAAQEPRMNEVKEMSVFKSLQEVAGKKDLGAHNDGSNSICRNGRGMFRSNYSTHEPIITEGSTWQVSEKYSDEVEGTKATEEEVCTGSWNEKGPMDSAKWERNKQLILPHENTEPNNES